MTYIPEVSDIVVDDNGDIGIVKDVQDLHNVIVIYPNEIPDNDGAGLWCLDPSCSDSEHYGGLKKLPGMKHCCG